MFRLAIVRRFGYDTGMRKHAYGQRPPDIGERTFALGWLSGVRHIVYRSARASQWHSHPEDALLFCIRGEYTYEFRDHTPVTLTAGSYLAFPRGLVHRHLQAIDPIGIRLEMLLRPENATDFALKRCETRNCIRGIFAQPLVARPCARQLLTAVRGLDAFAANGEKRMDFIDRARARLLAMSILLGCVRDECAPKPQVSPVKMDTVTAWMESHLAERLDIDRIVAHLGYSRTHVFTLFRNQTGLTPGDYLMRLRIGRARELLKSTGLSAREIAATCGFATPSAFGTTFKRLTGLTPKEYRGKQGGQ